MAYKTIFSICPKRIQKEVVGNVGNCKEFSVSLEIRGLNHPSIRIIGLEYSHPIIRNRWNTLRNLAYWAIARGASSPALPWWLLGWEKIGWPDGECGKGGGETVETSRMVKIHRQAWSSRLFLWRWRQVMSIIENWSRLIVSTKSIKILDLGSTNPIKKGWWPICSYSTVTAPALALRHVPSKPRRQTGDVRQWWLRVWACCCYWRLGPLRIGKSWSFPHPKPLAALAWFHAKKKKIKSKLRWPNMWNLLARLCKHI